MLLHILKSSEVKLTMAIITMRRWGVYKRANKREKKELETLSYSIAQFQFLTDV